MRLGLMGIVKDEAAAVRPMLRSIKPHICAAVMGDTGSTDGTPEIIGKELGTLPHIIRHDKWKNFSHNRNLVLDEAFASGLADYWLSMDADEIAKQRAPLPEDETAELVGLPLNYFPESSWAPRMVRTGAPVRWRWPIHEVLWKTMGPLTQNVWDCLTLTHTGTGHRARSGDRHKQNEHLLRAAVKADPTDTRMMFYLARELDRSESYPEAARYYKRRANWSREHFEEEGWYAMYRWGACLCRSGDTKGVDILLRATERRPHRAEPFADLASYYFAHGQDMLGYFFMARAEEMPYPTGDLLFIEMPLYQKATRALLEDDENLSYREQKCLA